MDKVGTVLPSALAKAGFTNFYKLSVVNLWTIELAPKKAPRFGNIVRDFVMSMPRYKIEVIQGDTKQNSEQVDVMVPMVNREMVGRREEVEPGQHRWVVLVGNGNIRVVATLIGWDTLLSGHSCLPEVTEADRGHVGGQPGGHPDQPHHLQSGCQLCSPQRLPGMLQPPAFPSRPLVVGGPPARGLNNQIKHPYYRNEL